MRLTATPLLLALSLALGTSMTAHAAPSSPSIAAPAEGTLLNISANAEATRVPDVATLSAGVVSQAADGNSAMRQNAQQMDKVLAAIKAAGIAVDEENSSVGLVPNMTAPVSDVAVAKAINKFVDMLEDLEDVQDVFTNMETTDEVDAALEAEG